jgi:hypothetical protein
MMELLQQAIDEAGKLPEADQEAIARQLLAHVDKIRRLRADLQAGIASLDGGQGQPLAIDELITRARRRAGR